jgi:hypothetical protein
LKVDQAPAQDTEAAAQPADAPALAPDLDAMVDALVRLLARQAAREHLERLGGPNAEEIADED